MNPVEYPCRAKKTDDSVMTKRHDKDDEWARAAVRSVVERCVIALAKQLELQAKALRRGWLP